MDLKSYVLGYAEGEKAGGIGGTTNYLMLDNKPQINGVELSGNMSGAELGLAYSAAFAQNEWAENGEVYVISVPAATHKCGKNPCVDVYALNGTDYIKFYGYPANGWTVSVNAEGDVSLSVNADGRFAGKIVIR